jgi:hypothetical protein
MGVCQPKCTFEVNGAMQLGCPAPDTCTFSIFAQLTSGASASVVGYGYCQGTCQRDADCTAFGMGSVCQADVGICTSQPVTRTLAIGDACTQADFTSGACNCDYDANTGTGFCTATCVVGGTPCPLGWVCDTGEPNALNVGNGTITVTIQTAGLAGTCLPSCVVSTDAGANDAASGDAPSFLDAGLMDVAPGDGRDASTASDGAPETMPAPPRCPTSSTCTSVTVAGPDCLP